jgi:glycerate kinase
MRVVIAPDSFKGSLTALAAAEAMARGVREVFPAAEVVAVPIADGGEGTVDALVAATGGRIVECTVSGPLGGPVTARWGVLGDGTTAVIETAAASGLTLLPPGRRDPGRATTRGTGELLRAALDAGLRRAVIGLGGSATTDGGAGLARALGVRFLDAGGRELPDGGAALARLARVDASRLDPRLAGADLLVACDVENPLTGPEGAAAVYGPQKGATPALVRELDAALARYAEVAGAATGRDVAAVPGAGAAGGLGAGLLLFTPARLRPGVARCWRRRGSRGCWRGPTWSSPARAGPTGRPPWARRPPAWPRRRAGAACRSSASRARWARGPRRCWPSASTRSPRPRPAR